MKTLLNKDIRFREVRVISNEGDQLGLMGSREALVLAEERGVDLVCVSPDARPPVCKIMDYGKYKYEQGKKLKESKKKSNNVVLKEVKISANISDHDFQTKINHTVKFLGKGHKVKVSLRMKGREVQHIGRVHDLMKKMQDSLECSVERPPNREGRQVYMILSPKK